MSTSKLRKAVSLWFILFYALVGVPLWYKLTAIYRAPLPVKYIEAVHENLHSDVHVTVPVYVRSDTYTFPDVHDAVQVQVNELLRSKQGPVTWSLQVLPFDNTTVDPELDHVVTLVLDDDIGFTILYDSKETIVFFNDETVASNDVPFFVAQTLVEHTFELEWRKFSSSTGANDQNSMAIEYSPNVHLSLSLLTGDGRPVAWDIEPVLQQYFTPLREFLAPLVNFTVDTDIVQVNDLKLASLRGATSPSWHDLSHAIDLSELSTTNYYKERSVLHLAIVFPSAAAGELDFINATTIHPWQSFLVPQWGVLMLNRKPLDDNTRITESYLKPVIYSFSRELLQLLGLTSGNEDLSTPYVTMESFQRMTILKNLEKSIDTLWSLVKLTQQFPQMAVPREVLDDVTAALDLRLKIVHLLNDPCKGGRSTWNEALHLSNELLALCEKAFFHKEMVQQNFFPQEHKIAVYLPLLGPLTVIMLTGFINAFRKKGLDLDKKER
ncbi:LAMI_0D11936g1_1 [Lachancea mirantina]|uniref:LAMI_0D11936g1_1 n=1 Tax=Lachancea mirantina TaxID=1230905 RepID=A0A1G4JFC4_9SACH|nr:LAMI_0D11936g1_1 [Lachancea mirantina]